MRVRRHVRRHLVFQGCRGLFQSDSLFRHETKELMEANILKYPVWNFKTNLKIVKTRHLSDGDGVYGIESYLSS